MKLILLLINLLVFGQLATSQSTGKTSKPNLTDFGIKAGKSREIIAQGIFWNESEKTLLIPKEYLLKRGQNNTYDIIDTKSNQRSATVSCACGDPGPISDGGPEGDCWPERSEDNNGNQIVRCESSCIVGCNMFGGNVGKPSQDPGRGYSLETNMISLSDFKTYKKGTARRVMNGKSKH